MPKIQGPIPMQERFPELFNSPSASLADIAPALGISKTSAYKAVSEGNFPFPHYRIGGRIVVPTQPIREALGLDKAVA